MDKDTAATLNRVVKTLADKDSERNLGILKLMLSNPGSIPLWRSVDCGNNTVDSLISELKSRGVGTGKNETIEAIKNGLVPKESANLVKVRFSDFANGKIGEFFERTAKLNLRPCSSAAIAAKLRLDYVDQPEGETLLVPFQPFNPTDEYFGCFKLVSAEDSPWAKMFSADDRVRAGLNGGLGLRLAHYHLRTTSWSTFDFECALEIK